MSFLHEKLWEVLEQKANEEDAKLQPDQRTSSEYLSAIKFICNFGVERAKTIRDTFPLYTLHDETHICNVLRIMEQLLGQSINELNRDEAAMLILAACCHDVGMSYSAQEKQELLQDKDRLDQYLEQHHDEYVKAYAENTEVPTLTEEIQRNYLRSIHHERILELLNSFEWPGCLWGKVDQDDLIRVCQNHGRNPSDLNNLECTPTIDLRFCAILLRLADILDFDITRAPKTLYHYCGFDHANGREAKISQMEWHKHIASQGFEFNHVADRSVPYDLPCHITSDSMQIEQAVHRYLDWVDYELNQCGILLRRYTGSWQNFILPNKINRIVKANGYVSGQYHLTMDQDKVMELLVGEELYSDPAAFVRELLQNAIDAVRTREQLDKNRPNSWKPQINIRSWMDEEGYHWFRIEDNGTGMTQEIIESYFLKIGRSYYTSDTFQKDKILCGANPEYTPISRFGIGILSCFMGGKHSNQVEVSTKRFATNGNRPSALRLRMQGMNGYYYLASQQKGHTPGHMAGVTDQEKRAYLQQPGTVVAVRTNLYQTGKYAGFKEIVDRYVVYPPVPVHYDGPEGSFDYVTKEKFMEAVHSVHPSDDLSQQGVLEFPLTENQMQELHELFPGLHFDEPPKIILKCIPLDRYTKSPYLSGALICTKSVINPKECLLRVGDQTIEFDIIFNIKLSREKLTLDIGISLSSLSIERALNLPQELNWVKNKYRTTLFHIKNIPWYQTYFFNMYNVVGLNDIAAHNGIFCGDNRCFFRELRDDSLGSILLLSDQYRPGVDLSRSQIRQISLETACDMILIQNELLNEGYVVKGTAEELLKSPAYLIPTSVYRSLVQQRPDLEERLLLHTGFVFYRWNELTEKIIQQSYICIAWPIYSFVLPFNDELPNPMDLIDQLCIACLKSHYDLRMAMNDDSDLIYVREKTVKQPELCSDIFPPSLFIYPDTECPYLTRAFCEDRHFCNAEHRLSQFMLKNADLLQQKVPGILKEMIRILQEKSGEHLISEINSFLNRLRSFPGQPIQVPSDLFLTIEDLYYTEKEVES